MSDSRPIPILRLRGVSVLLDADLARLYGVPTKRLNEQVKRNAVRFPDAVSVLPCSHPDSLPLADVYNPLP
jgi:hypothetical protein